MAVEIKDLADLESLDRPFMPVTVKIGGKDVDFLIRALTSEEEDLLEAQQQDEYGRLIKTMIEPREGALSELERVSAVYKTKTKSEIVEQIIPTRGPDIQRRAAEISGINFAAEAKKMSAMEEAEREAYAEEKNKEYDESVKVATDEVRQELLAQTEEHLSTQVAQINVNIRALTQSQEVYNSHYLFYVLHKPDESRVFANLSDVSSTLKTKTIAMLVDTAKGALKTDLPFELPEDSEPAGQPPSPPNSEADTTAGGEPIETTPDDSKPSTTP